MPERDPFGRPLSGNPEARPDAAGRFSDAAHRISDYVTQAIVDGKSGQWMVFELDEGRSNGKTYTNRGSAVIDAGSNADQRMYLKIPFDSCPPAEAASFLAYNRWAIRTMGGRLPDPKTDQVVLPKRMELLPPSVRAASQGLLIPRSRRVR